MAFVHTGLSPNELEPWRLKQSQGALELFLASSRLADQLDSSSREKHEPAAAQLIALPKSDAQPHNKLLLEVSRSSKLGTEEDCA